MSAPPLPGFRSHGDELPFALRARWVFPVDGPPIAGGVVTVCLGIILSTDHRWAEAHLPADRIHDLGDVALLPGLVNAHTHLEFSNLAHPLGEPGMALPRWIGDVLQARSARSDTAGAIAQGVAESLVAGVTAIGEIATEAWPEPALAALPRVTVFRELIGLSGERIGSALSAAAVHLASRDRVAVVGGGASSASPVWSQEVEGASQSAAPPPAMGHSIRVRAALSPHAPYTVHPQLLAEAVALARRHDRPVAMHIAESREELELLATGTGPLADLLQARGVWPPGLFGGRDVRALLEALSNAPRALVIHGNYLSSEDIAWLAERAARMSVVYCPRTHAYFGHDPYPLAKMLTAGVSLAVGTDSRASNPDLSLLEELRTIAYRHADVPLAKVLELGTLGGAKALGWDQEIGSLAAGKRADFCVTPITTRRTQDPHELLFDSQDWPCETWIDGRRVVSGVA